MKNVNNFVMIALGTLLLLTRPVKQTPQSEG